MVVRPRAADYREMIGEATRRVRLFLEASLVGCAYS